MKYIFSLWFQRVQDAKHVEGKFLHKGPERSKGKTVKMKHALCWLLQDVAMGYLTRKAAHREWN